VTLNGHRIRRSRLDVRDIKSANCGEAGRRMKPKTRTLYTCLALVFGVGSGSLVIAQTMENSSVRNVNENPSSFDSKRVRITGVAKIEFENVNLFESLNDAEAYSHATLSDTKNCIALLIPSDNYADWSRRFNDKIVTVTGRFEVDSCTKDAICPWWCGDNGVVVESIAEPRH
jgi:hypothetical protein